MPSIANIFVELHAPSFGSTCGGPIEEFAPLSDKNRKSWHYDDLGATSLSHKNPDQDDQDDSGGNTNHSCNKEDGPEPVFMPRVWNPKTRTVSVFVPVHEGAQWWVCYKAEPPLDAVHDDLSPELLERWAKEKETVKSKLDNEKRQVNKKGQSLASKKENTHCEATGDNWTLEHDIATVEDNGKGKPFLFWVFQLFINNKMIDCWSVGEDGKKFKGKTHFALYQGQRMAQNGSVHSTKQALMKRIFYFTPKDQMKNPLEDAMDRKIEVRVHRAYVAFRRPRMAHSFTGQWNTSQVRTEFGGFSQSNEPKEFYMYFLVDPLDQPFANFRFYYRTCEELNALSLRLGEVDGMDGCLWTYPGVKVYKNPKSKTIELKSDPEDKAYGLVNFGFRIPNVPLDPNFRSTPIPPHLGVWQYPVLAGPIPAHASRTGNISSAGAFHGNVFSRNGISLHGIAVPLAPIPGHGTRSNYSSTDPMHHLRQQWQQPFPAARGSFNFPCSHHLYALNPRHTVAAAQHSPQCLCAGPVDAAVLLPPNHPHSPQPSITWEKGLFHPDL